MTAKRQLDISSFLVGAASAKKPRVASPPANSIGATSSIATAAPTSPSLSQEASTSVSTFSPQSYAAKLSTSPPTSGSAASERDLLDLEIETLDPSWLELLKDEIRLPYFLSLKSFLWNEGLTRESMNKVSNKVFPAANNIYSWSRHTPIEKVRVVIIGQDPYHGVGQAHGLSFSVPPGVAIPPSLRNIYKEIAASHPGFVPPKHGNLISYADSGVLLLNTALTVRNGNAGSHSGKGWEKFTDKVIQLVDKYGGSGEVGKKGEGVVFLAWGAWAGKRVAALSSQKHLILKSAHPSPLSASRGFLGNGHFVKANTWLEKKYGAESKIDWTKLDAGAK